MFLLNLKIINYSLLFYALLFLVKNTPTLVNSPTMSITADTNRFDLSIVLGDALTVVAVLGVEGVIGELGVDGVEGTTGVTGVVAIVYTCTKSPFASRCEDTN